MAFLAGFYCLFLSPVDDSIQPCLTRSPTNVCAHWSLEVDKEVRCGFNLVIHKGDRGVFGNWPS